MARVSEVSLRGDISGQLPQSGDRLPVGPSSEPHVTDRGAENLRAIGVDRFIDAVQRALTSRTTHSTLIVSCDDDEFRAVCSCGWFGLTHVSREYAHADVCPFLEAEDDLSRRAGCVPEVVRELQSLVERSA